MQLHYRRFDVFTDEAFGGNPLAVFLDVPDLPTAVLQSVAREMNLSESVFVRSKTGVAEWPIRIFTPGIELPFAGHPTVGTAAAILLQGLCGDVERAHLDLMEGVGRVRVDVVRHGERRATATFTVPKLPEFGDADLPHSVLADLLGVNPDDILGEDWRPRAVSCGVPFYFVCLRTLEAVRRVRLRKDVWDRHLSRHWAPHLYVFTRQSERDGSSFHARMFPPAMAVDEDPATGGAAAALSGFLFQALRPAGGHHGWRIEQGFEIGRPSLIELAVDVGEAGLSAVRLTGRSISMGGGTLSL